MFRYLVSNKPLTSIDAVSSELYKHRRQYANAVQFAVGEKISAEVRREALSMLSGSHVGNWRKEDFPFSRRHSRPKIGPVWLIHSESGGYTLKRSLSVRSVRRNQYRRDVTVSFGNNKSAHVLTPGGLGPSTRTVGGKVYKTAGMHDRNWWVELSKRTRRIIRSTGAK